jgi:antirestriction protein ArdC
LKPVAQENQTTINATLVFFYSEQTGVSSQDFKTLEAWNNLGYMVKKGEKSYAIWGQRTKKTVNLEESRIAGEPEVIDFFPIVYLFSIDQVVKKEAWQSQQAMEATEAQTRKPRKGKSTKAIEAQA